MRQIILSFTLIALFINVAPAAAQTADGDWSRVENLRPNTSVFIQTKDGRELKAKISRAEPSSLAVRVDGRSTVIHRDSVEAIYGTRRGSRLKSALKGGLIGGLVGVGVLTIYTLAAKADPLTAAAGIEFGVPLGAVIGAVSGGKKKRGELLYRAL